MKSIYTFLSGLTAIAGLVWASETYWQQDVHYTMQVRLDTEKHELAGTSHIVYANQSPDTLRQFYLILYPNAFNVGSVKHREALQVYRTGGISEDNPSGIDVSSLTLTMPSGAATSDFKVDDTILEVQLPEPLAPGAQLTLGLEWIHTVRRHIDRAGRRGEQYDLAQWYPKVVVYDEHGWNNEPFHMTGEFYGEFSTFDVTIDVPYRYVVGATGVVTSGDPGWEAARVDTTVDFSEWAKTYKEERDSLLANNEDQRRIVTFHAEDVHDFAWITSPDFVYESGSWNGIQVNALYNLRVGEDWTKKVVQRSERALEWLSTRFGPYPYPQVTTTHGLLGGGMEYPMLVMNGSESESLIVHEIGHIWFYGALGNNEMEEAWLDEGFTVFQTRWYMTNRYGPLGFDPASVHDSWLQRHRKRTPDLGRTQWQVIALQTSGYNEPIATASYRSGSGFAYRTNAYPKASLMLESLQYILGEETFDRGMQSYYRQWALKHTNEYRFRRAMEQASPADGGGGRELDWFFDQWLHTAGYLDYALKGWRQHPVGGGYEVTVNLRRKGPWEAPVVVEAVTTSGQRVRDTWEDFRHRTTGTVTLQSPEKVRRIVLDPDDKLMDIDRRNNHSGMFPTTVGFLPLIENYLPRDEYTLSYWPVLRYNYIDQLTPVIKLERRYGPSSMAPYSNTELDLGYGLRSGTLDWQLRHRGPLFLHDTRITYNVDAFDRDGVQGSSVSLRRRWSRVYNLEPIYDARFTLKTINAYDATYAPHLFAPGRVTAFSTILGVERRTLNWNYQYTFTADAGAPTPLGDFDFSRFTFELKADRRLGPATLNFRLFAGRIWSTGFIPNQERFTVSAAGSMDYFNRPYLSADGALYGLPFNIQKHYHLPGDGNLRGYYDHYFFGVDGLTTTTTEINRSINIPILGRLGGRLFLDAGVLWRPRAWQCGSPDYSQGLEGDVLADFGLGLDWSKRIFDRSIYLRVDFPFLLLKDAYVNGDSGVDIDFTRWVFSFQQGL